MYVFYQRTLTAMLVCCLHRYSPAVESVTEESPRKTEETTTQKENVFKLN